MNILDRIAMWLDRRELNTLRREIAAMKEEKERSLPHMQYLKSRDALCSSLANQLNKANFEIAVLKGDYDAKYESGLTKPM